MTEEAAHKAVYMHFVNYHTLKTLCEQLEKCEAQPYAATQQHDLIRPLEEYEAFARLSKAFHKALGNAKRRGRLKDSAVLKEEADFFTASTLGLFVMIRAKAPNSTIVNAAKRAIRHLEELAASIKGG